MRDIIFDTDHHHGHELGPDGGSAALLARLETYYDAVPRFSATAEEHGPFTLFLRTGEGWHYYARPTLGSSGPFTADQVQQVRARQRAAGAPESFEWVHETTPGLRAAVEAAGLTVHAHPLLVLDLDDAAVPAPTSAPTPAPVSASASASTSTSTSTSTEDGGAEVLVLSPGDPLLPSAVALPHLAFAEPGTAVGTAGPEQLAAAARAAADDGSAARMEGRITAGRTVLAAVPGPDGLAISSGCHQPVEGVSEIVGIATLPALRRRGLARRLTLGLVEHARATGVRTVFLSASDEAVARIYQQVGFRRAATALIAEPPTTD
ncbi:GNAT family N-acetyltransferase [Kitasatospora sp. NPDC088134]|uniref:GNAT family N-acetyltransferase n=1 Tax=Kitasatospora sp. NPDC088134 TaxID=3364071 RepID=UPI0038003170